MPLFRVGNQPGRHSIIKQSRKKVDTPLRRHDIQVFWFAIHKVKGMPQGDFGAQPIELNREIAQFASVCFDAEGLRLQGKYSDQLSAYRAKKIWAHTLETCFLLDSGYDFKIKVQTESEDDNFGLVCEFLSACARYAFWRLTNHQAPEAQYLIETAHIPNAASRQGDFVAAPDLRCLMEDGLDLTHHELVRLQQRETLGARLRELVRQLFGVR